MRRAVFIFMAFLAIAAAGCSRPSQPVREGSMAPEFTLKDLNGTEVSLSSLRGNVVLVNFWATWCPPCREEIPSLAKLTSLVAGKPIRLLAVSIDDGGKGAVETLYSSMGVSLPTLLDPGAKTGKRYGTTGVPETFIIDRNGKIAKKVVGGLEWSHPQVVKFLEDLAQR